MTPLSLPLLALLALVTVGYALACLIWPFGNCRRCGGTGKLTSLFGGKGHRLCPRCHHTGRRVRLGRRLWRHWRDLRRDAA